MSKDTLYVSVGNRRIRTCGGNRSDVRALYSLYKNMDEKKFLNKHKLLEGEKFEDVHISMTCNPQKKITDEDMIKLGIYDELEKKLGVLNNKQKEILKHYYLTFNSVPKRFIRQILNSNLFR